jgi:hypothetical protein
VAERKTKPLGHSVRLTSLPSSAVSSPTAVWGECPGASEAAGVTKSGRESAVGLSLAKATGQTEQNQGYAAVCAAQSQDSVSISAAVKTVPRSPLSYPVPISVKRPIGNCAKISVRSLVGLYHHDRWDAGEA